MKCFYHSADLDGHCSGAFVKCIYPEVELIPINYGDVYDLDQIEDGETIFVVDFSFQPFEIMEQIADKANLIWLDHHKTAMKNAEDRNFTPLGIRDMRLSGCELTWMYLAPEKKVAGKSIPEKMPKAIQYLGRYDVWDHTNKNTLPFQYGCRMENTDPNNQEFWTNLFFTDDEHERIIKNGKIILEYQRQQDEMYIKSRGFEVELEGLKMIACNVGLRNSQLFDSAYDADKHDAMMIFCMLPNRKWTVSMYTSKEGIDVSDVAKKYGGGGHKGAAGFQCDKLPF